MVDMAAVGITALWWRNTKVEEWHAGADVGALSDIDMYRINTHHSQGSRTTSSVVRQQGIHTMNDIANADRDSLKTVVYNLYRWFTNPRRFLVTGSTLYELVAMLVVQWIIRLGVLVVAVGIRVAGPRRGLARCLSPRSRYARVGGRVGGPETCITPG